MTFEEIDLQDHFLFRGVEFIKVRFAKDRDNAVNAITKRKMRITASDMVTSCVRTYLDGTDWVAVKHDFIDLQESIAGFGHTPGGAVADLIDVLGEKYYWEAG